MIRVAYTKTYASNYDDIFRKPETPPRSRVMISGVCGCDVVEHCPKCDQEFFAKPPLPREATADVD